MSEPTGSTYRTWSQAPERDLTDTGRELLRPADRPHDANLCAGVRVRDVVLDAEGTISVCLPDELTVHYGPADNGHEWDRRYRWSDARARLLRLDLDERTYYEDGAPTVCRCPGRDHLPGCPS